MKNFLSCLHGCLLSLLIFCFLAGPLPSGAFAESGKVTPSWTGKGFRQGVVSVSTPLAAEVGATVLENGGNAIDAAAAIQFALNVVEPNFSGIGGGGFMMIHLAETGETFIVESREKAPAAATPDMFLGGCPRTSN